MNRAKVMRHLGATRQQLFDQVDRPALKPLPAEAYVFAEWRRCRPGLDYHVRIDEHGYSVPFALARTELDARITATTVEIFHKGKAGRQPHPPLPARPQHHARAHASRPPPFCRVDAGALARRRRQDWPQRRR